MQYAPTQVPAPGQVAAQAQALRMRRVNAARTGGGTGDIQELVSQRIRKHENKLMKLLLGMVLLVSACAGSPSPETQQFTFVDSLSNDSGKFIYISPVSGQGLTGFDIYDEDKNTKLVSVRKDSFSQIFLEHPRLLLYSNGDSSAWHRSELGGEVFGKKDKHTGYLWIQAAINRPGGNDKMLFCFEKSNMKGLSQIKYDSCGTLDLKNSWGDPIPLRTQKWVNSMNYEGWSTIAGNDFYITVNELKNQVFTLDLHSSQRDTFFLAHVYDTLSIKSCCWEYQDSMLSNHCTGERVEVRFSTHDH